MLTAGCPDPSGTDSTGGSDSTSSDASSEGGATTTGVADSTTDATTDATTGTTTASGDCDPPCEGGSVCVDGTCVEPECDPEVRCCVDGRPCVDECVGSEHCEGGTCVDRGGFLTCTAPSDLPSCDAGPALSRWIMLSFESDIAAALAVTDVLPSPGDELFVAGFESSMLLSDVGASSISGPTADERGPEAAFAVSLGGGATGFAVLRGFGGEVVLATLDVDALVVGPPQAPGIDRGTAADFDGDGIDDLFGSAGGLETQVLAYGDGTGFTPGPTLDRSAWAWVAAPFDDQAGPDVVLHELDGPSRLVTDVAGSPAVVALEGGVSDNRDLATGDFDGDGDADVVGLARSSDFVVLFPWQNVGGATPTYLSPVRAPDTPVPPARFWNTVGDFDGDGADDIAVGTSTVLRVYFGDPTGAGLLRCYASLDTPHPATTLAAGDFDDDGFEDVAFAGGTDELSIFAHD